MCTLSQKCGLARSRRPMIPSIRERQCALPTHRSCADIHERRSREVPSWTLSPRITTSQRQVSSPCGLRKRLLSCRPLRFCSLLVGSTVRHLGTPFVRWSACASCLSSVLTRVPSEEFRSSINLDERSPSFKFFQPTGILKRSHPAE